MIPSAVKHEFKVAAPVHLPIPQGERRRVRLHKPAPQAITEVHPDLENARHWFFLSIASLVLAGLFAVLLVVGRIPAAAPFIMDADFFKRCLVIHVNLSLLVWFCAFAASMFRLLPARTSPRITPASFAIPIAATGVLAMMAAAFLPQTTPILSNYIPFIDHPVFAVGLILFFAGLCLTYLGRRLFSADALAPDSIPGPDVATGLRVCAIATLLAITTFAASWAATPRDLAPEAFYEFVAWGGGHVLQVANVAAMVAIWLFLLRRLLGGPVISTRAAAILFGLLVAPHMVAPLLTIDGTLTPLYHRGSTQLMRFGIFPIVTIFLILCTWRLIQAGRQGKLETGFWKDARFIGFALSAGMTVIGFILGAMIRSSTTLVPAHYHASIGAVTVAFMAMAFLLLAPFGLRIRSPRLERLIPWQLGLFGVGQLVFAVGFAIGGAYGLDRKAYSSEQQVASLGEHIGLGIMGFGGLMAVAGGVLFLVLMIHAWKPRQSLPFFSHAKLHKSS